MPRGALFEETLDLLDAVGVDTAALRGDSRSLIFDDGRIVLVTLRPTDVPTYVEAGAADLGITGKDVLMEQPERVVYELLDLGYGRCRMVVAGRGGDERLGESERRLGAMRIATKYPRIAERHFEETGRQAEVIEVKGSVELAPLVGLADGIVDLVATGRTLEENELEVREEIADCTARLVANRVAHKLRGERDRRADARAARGEPTMRARALRVGGAPAASAAELRALAPRGRRERARRRRRGDRQEVREGGDEAVLSPDRALRRRRRPLPQPARSTPASCGRRARRHSIRELREALELAAANIRAVAEAQLEPEARERRACPRARR